MPFVRSTRCKVCCSKFMDQYQKQREEGKTFLVLQEMAKANGEQISSQAFRRHFRDHWLPYLDQVQKVEGSAVDIIQSRLRAGVNIVDEIYQNLTTLRELSKSSISLAKEDPRHIRFVTELLKEIRQTLDLILKLREKLDFEPKEDARAITRKIIKTLEKLVPEGTLAEWAHKLETSL